MVNLDGDDGGEAGHEDQLELLYEDMDRELADEIQTEKDKRLQKKESDDKVSKQKEQKDLEEFEALGLSIGTKSPSKDFEP